jgi:high-affinity K+ transport system ATPase subunit B
MKRSLARIICKREKMNKIRILGLISVLLVCTMIFTAFTPAFASTNGTEDQTSLKETDRNAYYTSIYSKLSRTFITIVHDENGDRAEIKYPADYAEHILMLQIPFISL